MKTRERVMQLRAQKRTFQEIADELGVTKGVVAGHVWRSTNPSISEAKRERRAALEKAAAKTASSFARSQRISRTDAYRAFYRAWRQGEAA